MLESDTCEGEGKARWQKEVAGRGAHLAMSLPAQQGVGSKDCPIEGPHVGQNG